MKQVLVIVNRGITDQTPTLVWPWEVPVLEAVHGEGNVQACEHAETLAWLEKNRVHVLSDGVPVDKESPDRRAISEVFNPANNIGGEYERLAAKYGQHLEMPIANVEYVYGRLSTGEFERAVRMHCKPTQPVVPTAIAGQQKKLSGAEVRKRLAELDVEYDPSAKVSDLQLLLRQKELERAGGSMLDEGGEPDGEDEKDAA